MLDGSERRYYDESDINTPNYTWIDYTPEFGDLVNNLITDGYRTQGRYMRIGNTVWWHIEINFEGISFGADNALYTTVPFESTMHTDSASGALHDVSAGKTHAIKGHYEKYSKILQLFYTTNIMTDEPMTHNQPVTLATEDYFHICGWYEVVPSDQAI